MYNIEIHKVLKNGHLKEENTLNTNISSKKNFDLLKTLKNGAKLKIQPKMN